MAGKSEPLPRPEWLADGKKVHVRSRGGGTYGAAIVERGTATRVVMTDGRQFRLNDHRQVGVDVYASPMLVPPDDPGLATYQREQEVHEALTPLRDVFSEYTTGARIWGMKGAAEARRMAEEIRDAAQQALTDLPLPTEEG